MDNEFYHGLYKAVKPEIERLVNKSFFTFTHSKEEVVKDILQDGMVIYLNCLGNKPLDKEEKVINHKGLYYKTCYYAFLSLQNKTNKGQTQPLDEMEFPFEEVDNERIITLRQCIEALGNDRHKTLMESKLEDLSSKEIAEMLKYSSANTIDNTVQRCYEKIRDCFKRKGVTL